MFSFAPQTSASKSMRFFWKFVRIYINPSSWFRNSLSSRDVGATTELVAGLYESSKKKFPTGSPLWKRSKWFCMINLCERGCPQLFPGIKILGKGLLTAEKSCLDVRALRAEETIFQIRKLQPSAIGNPFVIVHKSWKFWLMHLNIACSDFKSAFLGRQWIFFQKFGIWE